MRDLGALGAIHGIPREHDVRAIRQRAPRERLVRPPAHDERFPDGQRAHMLHVVREPPGEHPVLADHAVLVGRDHEGDATQTAILASMGGWNWYCSSRATASSSGPGFSPARARDTMS